MITNLVQQMVGCNFLEGQIHCLLRSAPERLQRQLPTMTPSTLSMGTILKTKFSRSILAVGLLPRRKSIMYSIMKLDIVSPGCTLAVRIIARFSLLGLQPIVKQSQLNYIAYLNYLLPDQVKQRNFLWKRFFLTGSSSMDLRYFWRWVQVQGQQCAINTLSQSSSSMNQ